MNDTELYKKLDKEALDLQDKIEKLDAFVQSDKSEYIPKAHKQLLICQLQAMRTYGAILHSRMYLIVEDKPETQYYPTTSQHEEEAWRIKEQDGITVEIGALNES